MEIIKTKKPSSKNNDKNSSQKSKTMSAVSGQSCLKMYDYMIL
ncbi:MAG: hypothetical protein ACM3X7_14490 [Solirubrobacterales bacterium]